MQELVLSRTRDKAMMSLLKKSNIARANTLPGLDHLCFSDQITEPKHIVVDECDGTGTIISVE